MFWYRRKEAIKLAYFILVIEVYKDILRLRDEKLKNYFLRKSQEEVYRKKLPGSGTTKGWKAYSKITSSNTFLSTWEIIKLLITL